jgi:ABC-2 type transport system ATP-binding protein
MQAIQIEGLVKTFGEVRALDGLTLSVEAGSVFGFLGPNGAGKTTTIRILTGLARATAGRAWVDGVEVTAGRQASARHIGYLPQDPAFYPWMTGRELLDHVGRVFGLPAAERRARVKELLELTGLTKAARRRIGGYSGGMRHRLGIAQALVNRPRVLLLDEPVSSLDPVGRKDLLELIERLRGECTVLMSTHILADVERVCDTVGIIDQGKLVIQAPQQELLERYAAPVFVVETEEECVPQLQAWAEALRSLPWVVSVAIEKQSARVLVKDLATAKRELAASALRAGVILIRYELGIPSLEEVFMQLVGEGGDQ